MNIMLVLLSMGFICGGIGLFLGLMDRAKDRRIARQKRSRLSPTNAAALCLMLVVLPLAAQEVVHAQTGKVVNVNTATKTLTLQLPDGSKVSYQDVSSHEPALSLDKAVREKTVPVGTFGKVGSNAVVLYFGVDSPTAVAIRDLGSDEPKESVGSVSTFDRHQHSLTLKTGAGELETVRLTEDTIFDTSDGVVKLADFKPSKGDHLRCVTSSDSKTAFFVATQ